MHATLLAVILSLLPAPAAPADSMRVMRFNAGEVFSLPGVGALIVREGSSLRVQAVPPPENRSERFRGIDLREDDRIMLLNGKRVKTIAEFEKAYAAIAVGAETKLGIQRGEQLMIASYMKPDPKDLPQKTMRIVKGAGEGTEVLPAVGVMLGEKGGHVVISALIDDATTAVRGLDVKEGDAITAVNGTPVTTVRSFLSVFDAVAVGAKVAWMLERNGKRIAVEFARPQPRGNVIIRRKSE